ncbi:Transcriptional regulator SutA [Thalassocella blandensis]|nr:Transcriptional regulator SutA [Thalassocella blandensis]
MSDEHEIDDDDIEVGEEEVDTEESAESDSKETYSLDSSSYAKEMERKRLQADIEAFLAAGGTINRIDSNVISDPPKRPESNYGGQPI